MAARLLALLILALTAVGTAQADGKADWTGYAWKTIALRTCVATGGRLTCPLYHQKWDWKRNQWVDIAISIDPGSGTLALTQQLSNNDGADWDDVCVTALVTDAAGANLVAHHRNTPMRPGETTRSDFVYRSTRLDEAASIHIGSKQCRNGPGQDDATYRRVLDGIGT